VTWPNKITYTRILFIPVFAIAAFQVGRHPAFRYVALGLFAVIALTDLLDGYIARRFHLTSLEGKFIDPLADKLLMVTACVLLALPLWGMPEGRAPLAVEVATVIVARDVLICVWVTATFLAGAKRVYEASRLGRATTFVQMLMIGAMLLGAIVLWVHTYVAVPLSYAAVAFTIASGLQYLYRYARAANLGGTAGGNAS